MELKKMKRNIQLANLYFIVLSLSLFLISIPTDAKDWKDLYEIYKNSQTSGNYVKPGIRELEKAQYLFQSLFTFADLSGLENILQELHLKVIKMNINNKFLLILVEKETHQTGRGFYIFLHNKFAQNVLQMPHRQKDLYTGEIGLSLLIEGNFAAGAWNSISRYYFQGNKKVSADLADYSQSYFIAFSKAFALCHSKGHIIQLHGFSTKKRRTRAGKQSSFILSAGSWNQSKQLINLDQCLEKQFLCISSLFPIEINELGGTQNTIGIALRQMGHNGFVHLEINKSFRNQLRKEKSMRQKLLKCIEGLSL